MPTRDSAYHVAQAEFYLKTSQDEAAGKGNSLTAQYFVAVAQVHATLAVAKK